MPTASTPVPSSTPPSSPAAASTSATPSAAPTPTPYRGFPLRHPALPPVNLPPDPESAELFGQVFG
ncbi:hypothetical protein ACWGJZ_38210, partial [Streptomyces rimosus]